jgi:hypothetical protein
MKFRPSNGTEGDMFIDQNCAKCIHEPDSSGEWCDIFGRANAFEIDDPRYPTEWQCEDKLDPRTWVCTARSDL